MDEAIAGPRCPVCGDDRWHDRTMPERNHRGLALADLQFAARPARAQPRTVTLAMIARAGDSDLAPHLADRIVLLDGSDADAAALARAVPGARGCTAMLG